MNENSDICEKINYNSCRGCLKTDEYVRKADESIVIKYKTLLSNYLAQTTNELYLCIYCITLINKITKFVQQCLEIDRRLNDFFHMIPEKYFNLTTSNVYSFGYVGKDEIDDINVKSELGDAADDRVSDDDDMPLVMFKGDEPIKDENKILREHIKLESTEIDNHKKRRKTKSCTKKTRYKSEDVMKEGVKKVVKKPLRAGFSSRMTQETDSYLVIKLSHVEVAAEMMERRKSEKYSRAPFKCDKCAKGFNFEDILAAHLEKHTTKSGTIKCEICSQYCPSVVSMRGHMKSHTTRYKCKICNVIRISRQHLLEHFMNTHTGESITYSCTECDYVTIKRTAMQRHSRTHSTNQRYSCETCGQLFKNKESLRAHFLRHANSQKYQCPMCTRTFLYPSLLRAHIQSSHTEQDHYCVECDIRFKTRQNLKSHFKKSKAHRDPNYLFYKCPHCPSKFQASSLLRDHVASQHGDLEGGMRCALCDKMYSTVDTLRAHSRRVHKFEGTRKKHACHYCHLSFTQRGVLTKHIRVHTGERPYACPECGLTFAQHSTRQTHLRLVHRKLPRSVKKTQELQQNNFQTEPLSQHIAV